MIGIMPVANFSEVLKSISTVKLIGYQFSVRPITRPNRFQPPHSSPDHL